MSSPETSDCDRGSVVRVFVEGGRAIDIRLESHPSSPNPVRQNSFHQPNEDMTGFLASIGDGKATPEAGQDNDGSHWDKLDEVLVANDLALIERHSKGIEALLILVSQLITFSKTIVLIIRY